MMEKKSKKKDVRKLNLFCCYIVFIFYFSAWVLCVVIHPKCNLCVNICILIIYIVCIQNEVIIKTFIFEKQILRTKTNGVYVTFSRNIHIIINYIVEK